MLHLADYVEMYGIGLRVPFSEPTDTKLHVYKAVVLPTVLYAWHASETLTVYQCHVKKPKHFHTSGLITFVISFLFSELTKRVFKYLGISTETGKLFIISCSVPNGPISRISDSVSKLHFFSCKHDVEMWHYSCRDYPQKRGISFFEGQTSLCAPNR